ncbi:MAG: DMT family transporter [Pseudomonadota bacterium]
MSTAVASPSASSRTLTGIVCVVIGMSFFAAQDALMKEYLPSYSIWALLFLRSCMAVVVLGPLILIIGGARMLRTRLMHIHCLRGALFAIGFAVFYMAFPFMGLAEATTIFFSAPLIIALMAILFLGERIGPHRIAALTMGFVGVLIAINPTGSVFTWISLLPLISAVLYAASQILARYVGDRESSLTVGLYTLMWSGPVVLAMGFILNQIFSFDAEFSHMIWANPEVPPSHVLPLICLGAAGLTGYVLLSRAYQVAEPSKISLFDYSYLPIATTIAWVIWSEVPPTNTIIGMVLVILSGIYIGIREMRQNADTQDPAPVSETLTAPGNPLPGPSTSEDPPT